MTERASTGSRMAEGGFRGARLGSPYVYRWVDLEPTNTTWRNRSERRGVLGAFSGVFVVAILGSVFGGERGLILGTLFLGVFGAAIGGLTAQFWGRTDTEPVPKRVQREAYIEYADGDFYFVLHEDDKVCIWQRWDLVRQFEKVDYWPMFGDAGASPYKTGWHAIIMTPLVGKPWLIASSIEADAELRDRFTNLDVRFSADTRAVFMRALEARKSGASLPSTSTNSSELAGSTPRPQAVDGVPRQL